MYLKLQQMQAQIEQPEMNIKFNDIYTETPTFFVLKIGIRVICHHINNGPGDSITITFLNVIVSTSTSQTYFNIKMNLKHSKRNKIVVVLMIDLYYVSSINDFK